MAKLITKQYVNKTQNTKASGKTYSRVFHTETYSTEEFAQHISDHGSPFSRATIMGVLMEIVDCLIELTLDSKKVRLGDLGTFYMGVESTGEENPADYSAANIEAVHLRFTPNLSHTFPLDSKSLRKRASFLSLDKADSDADNAATDTAPTGE